MVKNKSKLLTWLAMVAQIMLMCVQMQVFRDLDNYASGFYFVFSEISSFLVLLWERDLLYLLFLRENMVKMKKNTLLNALGKMTFTQKGNVVLFGSLLVTNFVVYIVFYDFLQIAYYFMIMGCLTNFIAVLVMWREIKNG